MFGPGLGAARRYAAELATTGVELGVLGPREVPGLWDRHLVNGAVLAALVPRAATVVDVGSGAGLPGVPLALARPDVRVTLLEPLARRVAFLQSVLAAVDVPGVRVVRGRAGVAGPLDVDGRSLPWEPVDVATARAVAPLGRLLGLLVPLVRPGGTVLAVKGRTAADELTDARAAGLPPGVEDAELVRVGTGASAATVVRAVVGRPSRPGARRTAGVRR